MAGKRWCMMGKLPRNGDFHATPSQTRNWWAAQGREEIKIGIRMCCKAGCSLEQGGHDFASPIRCYKYGLGGGGEAVDAVDGRRHAYRRMRTRSSAPRGESINCVEDTTARVCFLLLTFRSTGRSGKGGEDPRDNGNGNGLWFV